MAALIQIDGWDPSAGGGAGAAVAIRLASHDDDRVCHLNDLTWWPVVAQLPALRYDLFSGDFDGKIGTPGSTLSFSTEPWSALPGWLLADARVRIWTGQVAAPWSQWALRFDGRATAQPAIDEGFATLSIAVDDRWLDTPVLSIYAGTGGAEGAAALKGSPKPLALGAPRYAAGVMIDPTNLVVQLSAYGAIEDGEAALDRLVRFSAPIGDYASYAALIAATIPAGQWATAEAVGMVRHGAPPAGKLSYLLKGDKAGPDGWARKPGEIIRRIALLAGGTGKIDDYSLDALDIARPWNLSLMVTEQTTARELIQRIAASVNAVAGVSWLGKLFVAPVAINAGTASVELIGGGDPLLGDGELLVTTGDPGVTGIEMLPDGTFLPIVRGIKQIETGPPWWRLDLGAERTWDVHSLAEIAFFDLDAQNVKYADGTPIEGLKPAQAGATSGAPTGTSVAGTAAATVAAGANAANAGVNSDGTIKGNKVETPAVVANAITGNFYVEDDTVYNFASATKTEILSRTFGKITDGQLQVSAQIGFAASDAVDCYVIIDILSGATIVASRTFTSKIDGNNSTIYTPNHSAFFDGIAAGSYEASLSVQRFSANTLSTDGTLFHMNATELKK